MADELSALHKIGNLVALPLGKHDIGFRWVDKIEIKFDGSVESYKAKLIVKGFN